MLSECRFTGGYGGIAEDSYDVDRPRTAGTATGDVEISHCTFDGLSTGIDLYLPYLHLVRSTVRDDAYGIVCGNCEIDHSTFENNTAVALWEVEGSATVDHSSFTGNSAATIQILGWGRPLTILSSHLYENSGAPAVSFVGPAVQTTVLTIEDSVIENKTGGGISASPDGSSVELRMERTRVSANHGAAVGGGIEITNGYQCVIADSTISDNSATLAGGGLALEVSESTIVNTTISGNQAPKGGGIYVPYEGTSVQLTNVTIAGNQARRGSAFYLQGEEGVASVVSARNLLVSGDCARLPGGSGFASEGGNVEGPGDSCGFDLPTDRHGVARLGLGPLRDNGGPTPTQALSRTSPAIDAGLSTACPRTDQRGEPRPADGNHDGSAACDAGAFERER